MKPKDIIVGRKYKHKNYPHVVYLGIGYYNGEDYVDKTLIVLEGTGNIGDIVIKYNSNDVFWRGFYLIEE